MPIEFPTTRQLGATAEARAADINAAFADPRIRAVIATTGATMRSPSFLMWIPRL